MAIVCACAQDGAFFPVVEGVLEHGKLWCLVHRMWKVLYPVCWLWCLGAALACRRKTPVV
jgi:hypothetical protein